MAKDRGDRIIYDTDDGILYYDEDGTGGQPRAQFGYLSPGLNLTASDFVVV